MSNLFPHLEGHHHYDSRIDDISSFIVEHFQQNVSNNAQFLIQDPYLNPFADIYEPMVKNEIDNHLYSKVIFNLVDGYKNISFKILTDFPLISLREVLKKNDTKSTCYASFDLNDSLGTVEIIKYNSKSNTFPNKLHDRWFLMKVNETFTGLHLGPSMGDFKEKDFTITQFDQKMAKIIGTRYEIIWGQAIARNLK